MTTRSYNTNADCYACDALCDGVTLHNGTVKGACKRHMDPTMKAAPVCMYCGDAVRKGSVGVDRDAAHAKCQRKASR